MIRFAAVWLLLAAVLQPSNGLSPQLFSMPLDFVQFLGQLGTSWNHTDPATAYYDQQCLNQFELFSVDLNKGELWAVNFFDTWGKIPSGVLFGNIYELGSFDQCRRVRHDHHYGTTTLEGQHCTLMVNVRSLGIPVPIWYGLCVPAVCRPRFVGQLANTFLRDRGMQVVNDPEMFCYRNEQKTFSAVTVAAIVIFSCYAALILLATVADVVYTKSNAAIPPTLQRFSAYTNLPKIFATSPPSTSKSGTMDCVNGIRALSMLWIIVNHVHDTALGLPTSNHIVRVEYANSYFGVLFHKLGGKAVDIFLMLSGMLVAMKVLRELDTRGRLNVLELYLHRIIRILPAFAAMIFFVVAFIDHLGAEGVMAKLVGELIDPCVNYWWKALLFFHNYLHFSDMCFPHTWYISVDMQLYILSPLVLIPLWKFGKRFVPVIVLLALLSISCVFTVFMVNEYRLNKAAPVGDGMMPSKTYHPTHARMSVWLFGVLFGYLLHRTKNRTVRLPRIAQLVGWTLVAVVLIVTGYSLKQLYTGDYTTIPVVADAFYESLHRSFWAFVVMWVIFVSINGQGGWVNGFLSWRFWQPLAKLSYTMYLLHIAIQVLVVTMPLKVPLYFSVVGIFYSISGLVFITFVVATVWSVAFEYPFFGLEKIVFKKKE